MGYKIKPKYPLFLKEIGNCNCKSDSDENNIGCYPVVTIEDNFNIDAQPNTFYDVKNDANSDVNINLIDDYISYKYLFFRYEDNDNPDNIFNILGLTGCVVKPDTSRSGYKYSGDVYINLDETPIKGIAFFDDAIKTGNTVNYLISIDGESEITGKASNITVFNDNEDYLLEVNVNGTLVNNILVYKEYIAEVNMFIYDVYGTLTLMGISQLGTEVPYQEAIEFFNENGDILNNMFEVKVKKNKGEIIREIVNEFIINVKSPANITFNEEIKWNNNEEPDLTKEGVYTISIVNGIACYTFVNS